MLSSERRIPEPLGRLSTGLVACVAITGALLAAPLLLGAMERYQSFLPPCLFHELTGLYCTGCGSTRAVAALLHGDLAMAWRQNPLLLLTLPWVAYGVLDWSLARIAPSRRLWAWNVPGRLSWWFAALVVLFMIARNLPFVRFLGPLS